MCSYDEYNVYVDEPCQCGRGWLSMVTCLTRLLREMKPKSTFWLAHKESEKGLFIL